jgi:hypothetical protein
MHFTDTTGPTRGDQAIKGGRSVMKKVAYIAALTCLSSGLLGGSALAYPTQSGPCSNCHDVNSNVVVSATPLGCTVKDGVTQASYDYQLTVSNTFEQLEGYGVFNGTAKVKYGYGPSTGGLSVVLSLDQSKTFTLWGVSDSDFSDAAHGYGKGGSNSSTVTTPFCAACIDADGDLFSATGGGCGLRDCNDANAAINPNAVEIANNGVDENCNGYDLTIVVTKAAWSRSGKTLTIEASSALGASAGLSAYYTQSGYQYYAPLAWNAAIGKWRAIVTQVTTAPTSVTVSGIEGSVTAPVTKVK